MISKHDLINRILTATFVVHLLNEINFSFRFLVAIDRRNGAEVAMETVKLAEEFMLSSDGLVLGLDLSGDPTVSQLTGLGGFRVHKLDLRTIHFKTGTWLSGFQFRLAMVGTSFLLCRGPRTQDWSCHCTSQKYASTFRILFSIETMRFSVLTLRQKLLQVSSQLEESDLLLNLPPDRIGHGTFLHPEVGGSKTLVDKVVKNNIPLGKTEITSVLFCSMFGLWHAGFCLS